MKTLWLRRYKGKPPVPVLLDDEDYDMAAQHKWQRNFHGYVVGKLDGKMMYLHRFLMGFPEGKAIDHINGDKLDNRRCNLRICDNKDNVRNAGIRKNNTSGHSGVSYQARCKKYRAYIMVDRRQIPLGNYSTFEEAVRARKQAERDYFGEFAYQGMG